MKRTLVILSFLPMLFAPTLLPAAETAPGLTEQELIERLTKLEEGQNTLREDIRQLREGMNLLRQDMNAQFGWLINIMMVIVLAFAGVVATTIGFALWDRRTMIRPFESDVRPDPSLLSSAVSSQEDASLVIGVK